MNDDDLKWTAVLKRHVMQVVVVFFCIVGSVNAFLSDIPLAYGFWPLLAGMWVIVAAMKEEVIYIMTDTLEITDRIVEVQRRTITLYESSIGRP